MIKPPLSCSTCFSANTGLLKNNKQQLGLVGMLIGIGEITGMAGLKHFLSSDCHFIDRSIHLLIKDDHI